jgi:hypothetical protein
MPLSALSGGGQENPYPNFPIKISVFAEDGQTILITSNRRLFAAIAGDAVDPVIFERWESDLRSIFHDVSMSE